MFKKFFTFGKMTAVQAITSLFYVGLMPLLIKACFIFRQVYLANKYDKMITYMKDGQQWYTTTPVNNAPLALLEGIGAFIIMVLVWRLLCELLIMIFRCFEVYVRRNDC